MATPRNPLDALYRRPGFMLRRAHQIAVSLFLEETGELNITTTQFGILHLLKHSPGLDQITVAKLLGLDRSTTRVIARQLSAFPPRERALFLAMLEKFTRTFNESTRVPLEAQRAKRVSSRRKIIET
jgi:hypothetical protein